MPLGRYWRTSSFVFWFVPRIWGEPGLAKNTPFVEQVGYEVVSCHLAALVPCERQGLVRWGAAHRLGQRGDELFGGAPMWKVDQVQVGGSVVDQGSHRGPAHQVDDEVTLPVAQATALSHDHWS